MLVEILKYAVEMGGDYMFWTIVLAVILGIMISVACGIIRN